MQITQDQIDALTAEETDLTAAIGNAVTRSQTAIAAVPALQDQVKKLAAQVADFGAPADLTAINLGFATILSEVGAIAAPGVVVPGAGAPTVQAAATIIADTPKAQALPAAGSPGIVAGASVPDGQPQTAATLNISTPATVPELSPATESQSVAVAAAEAQPQGAPADQSTPPEKVTTPETTPAPESKTA